MKNLSRAFAYLLVYLTLGTGNAWANSTDNQTDTLSPIASESGLPFHIVIQQANFQLPAGFHSGVVGVYQGQWVFIGGKTDGLHGFSIDPFPIDAQNTSIFVVNLATGSVTSRSLLDPSSGLNQQQIDNLSVISPEGYQEDNTLYMVGGYGYDTATASYTTKPLLTAFYLPGIIQWVTNPGNKSNSVIKNMSQISNPLFQVTGGKIFKSGNMTQLVFGQDFEGVYTDASNGNYSEQVRQFQITGSGGQLGVNIYNSIPATPDANFRRRDLNVVPTIFNNNNVIQYGLVAYAGVFTVAGGVWTVPVVINGSNNPVMADPTLSSTFKQGMNQYECANVGLYSRNSGNMYSILFGGDSYGYYLNGVFTTDSEIPFINEVTTVQMDKNGNFTQYLMNNQYPNILATSGPNVGNQLLFGAGAYFIPNNIPQYPNHVINLDNIRKATVIGYIVGGIASTLANTNTQLDSSASPYVFTVTLVPN